MAMNEYTNEEIANAMRFSHGCQHELVRVGKNKFRCKKCQIWFQLSQIFD